MFKLISEIATRLAEVERRLAGVVRHGPIAEVDPSAGTVRLDLGPSTDGGRQLSPPIPYAQTAGALKAHIPPTVGQQMTMISPSGDWRQAVAMPMTWSDHNSSPSAKGDENLVTFGGVEISLRADAIEVKVGGVSFAISDAGVDITGGAVRHNGRNIGHDHIHGGVRSGAENTQPPAN